MIDREGAERRRDFRVQDQILLDYKVVSDSEMRGALRNLVLVDSSELNATTSLRRLENDFQEALHALQKEHKEAARCLDLLNNKLNTLTSLVAAAKEVDPAMEAREVRKCSLSASGIAFANHEPLPLDANLRLRMVVLPHYHHVMAYGKVMRVDVMKEPEPPYTHVIGVRFEHILDRYREILARRALQREIEDLRVRRLEKESAKNDNTAAG